MLLVEIFAALGLIGFLSAVLMGVTVVGLCRYGDRYRLFFDKLKTLKGLELVKEMSKVYYAVLNKFPGRNVGFKQRGVLSKSKFFGLYVEHLLLFYWVAGTILVLAFRPIEQAEVTSSLLQAAAFVTLLTINVASDAVSLLWTKRCIAMLAVPKAHLNLKRLFKALTQDIIVAVALMLVVQFVSNGLYAVQIGRPHRFWECLLDWKTAFKPYAAADPTFSTIQFPGQLIITCTTYLPSLFFYFLCTAIICLMPAYRVLLWLFNLFNLSDPNHSSAELGAACTQLGFIGLMVGVATFGMTSAAVFIGAWVLIRPV
jgi:hypothetical protein